LKFKRYYIIATLFYFIAISTHIIYNYLSTKQAMARHIDMLLENSAYIAPLVLQDTFHNRHMTEFPLAPSEDMENILKLSKQAKALKVKYIYTLIQEEDKIIFTSSSATDEELATKKNLTRFGDVYDDASPIISKVFSSQKSSYAEYKDKWGEFRSFYIPQIGPDGTKYVVGADMDTSYLKEKLHQNLFYSLKNMIFYIIILIPFFLVYRTNTQHTKRELEEIIAKRTNELEIKQKQIFQQSKMAAMGEMISNIAHQWRQPLSVISTSASVALVLDDVGILTKEKLHSGMESIMHNTEYLSKTIDNFRNFFTPNKPKEIQTLVEIFETIDCIFGNSLEVANIKLVKNIENITLNTYVNELSQVIVNLIKNSKDAIEDTGVILVDCFVDDKIYIKVKDSGGGIPDDVIDKIYEPYFTTKHQSIGTGIGLNMSHQIVTGHLGGEIEVHNIEFNYENTIYKGAEFIITLPIASTVIVL